MITSEDVRRVTFDRTVRGYRCEDVDDYLKQVADSMDAMRSEQDDLQKKIVVLAQRIDKYRADESTLSTTMLNAQRLGENVIKEAKQKAAEILREANLRAEDREQRARDEMTLCQQEVTTLHREADNFKKNLQKMYKEHIELISKLPSFVEEPAEEKPTAKEVPSAVSEDAMEDPEESDIASAETFDAPETRYTDSSTLDATGISGPEMVDTVEFMPEGTVSTEDPREQPSLTVAEGTGETRYVSASGRDDAPVADPIEGLSGFTGVDFDS